MFLASCHIARPNARSSRVFLLVALTCCLVAFGAFVQLAERAWAAPALQTSTTFDGSVYASGAKPKAVNVKSKASKRMLFQYGWSNGSYHAKSKKRTTSFDVTGDKRADVVTVSLDAASAKMGVAKSLLIDVNGSVAFSLAPDEGIDQVEVQVVTLRNNRPFLFVSAYGPRGMARQSLLGYARGAFTQIVGNGLIAGEGVAHAAISGIDVIGNRVVLEFDFMSSITGLTRTSFSYAWKGSSLKLAADSTSAIRYATTSAGEYTRVACKAARSFAAYATPRLAKRSFIVAANAKARPVMLRLTGGRLLFKVQCGARVGWVAPPSFDSLGGKPLLGAAQGAGPLSTNPYSFASKKTRSVAALQKLDNHALFLTRNEVYARRGFTFSNAELAAHFAGESWYKPRSNRTVKLSKSEQNYVARILQLEKNRRSPYVS